MSDDGMVETVNRAAEAGRGEFYERAAQESLAPLWRVLHGLVTQTPQTPCLPAHWSYERIRPYLIEACDLISTEEAQRRVLILENPGMPGQSRITRSLFAGLQIIRPGEIAPAHRHVASALRFIIEGKGAYTAVDGERTMMEPGDFVITPSWTWHDHGNESDVPMVWLDGLDMHIVNLLDASFREDYPGGAYPVTRPEGSAYAEAGRNLLPVDFQGGGQTSPIFNYPYGATREALQRLTHLRDPDECHSYKMRYINPVNGGPAMPTLSTAMQLLPRGFKSQAYRCTSGTVFVIVEGSGHVRIGERRFTWQPHDLFVVPSWHSFELEAASEAVIFSYSDQIVQEKLGLFREQRGNG
ncbi:MAG TPA: gentisate 1,2-dioxygenase [Steroidobacteraceae bacterium]|nr:gentisate 1,2-dioxygenase [Steroidobacteraceae bacterium]